ncbi:MAG: tRNA (guanosine(46)-N7)-methyltransferase TrmB [Sulfurovum sp.]|nr:tRNA (guanosine(46)-N7)-methyltransferase TrmB [Sulfurovum sp.]
MPHIKVKPFKIEILNDLISRSEHFIFRAIDLHGQHEMLGVDFEGEQFMLEIKEKNNLCQIKPDGISRPLDSDKIKRVLSLLIQELKLEVEHSNITLHPHKPMPAEIYNKKIRDFEEPLFYKDKIAIEVGFGSGRHLLFQAKNNPDTLFVGIEIHTPSAQQVLKQIALQGLDNIWIVNYDARLLLEMMPSNSCSHIYVHFPVPWDKKPHRRVLGECFLKESLRVLEKGAGLELRTDSDKYYAHALEVFSSPPKVEFTVNKNLDLSVVSKYEDRWRAKKKDIYTLAIYSKENSSQKKREYSFEFEESIKMPNLIDLPNETLVQASFFVHFERKYRVVESEDMIIRCAFGSFDKPEHKYLVQHDSMLRYYPQNPAKTEVNYLAHKQIGEFIYG